MATGTFGATPLANLLIYVLDRGLDGTLVIEHGDQRSAVVFKRGAPLKIKTAFPEPYLGDVLVSLGLLEAGARSRLGELALKQKMLFGALLLAERSVDVAALRQGLGEQILQKLARLAALPPTTVFGYYDGIDYLAKYGGVESPTLEPLAAIARVIQDVGGGANEQLALKLLGDRPLKPHPLSRLNAFRFGKREQAVVDVLRAKPHSLSQLAATGLLPEAALRRVVYTLVACRHVDLGAGTVPVGVGAQAARPAQAPASPEPWGNVAPPPAPSRPSNPDVREAPAQAPLFGAPPAPETVAFRAEIQARAEKIGSETYYDILGVARDAPAQTISAAFFQLAKKWHPDRLGPEFATVKHVAERVFARMTEAHQILTNDEQRREYERMLREGGATDDEQAKVQQVLRAAANYQKAEVMLRRGNLAEAEKFARLACDEDPEQAEYVALHAEILSQEPGANLFDLIKRVDEARQREPNNVKVRWYRARVLKRAGELEDAIQEFDWVAEKEPHNVEAAREVRIYRMRGGKPGDDRKRESKLPSADKGKGTGLNQDVASLFGKLFKR